MTNQESDSYGEGYAAGKTKCHEELRGWSPHARRCGCEPCLTVAAVVKTVLSAADIQVIAPPGVKASVSIEVRDG